MPGRLSARQARRWLIGASFALSLGLLGCVDREPDPEPLPPVGTEAGRRAPPLSGSLAAGEPYELQPDGSAATVVVFYRGAYCGLCRERLRLLEEHRAAYAGAGATVVAVTLDPTAAARRITDDLGLGFPVVSTDSAVFAAWAVFPDDGGAPLPASYLLDGRGVIRFRHIGRNAGDRASDAALLAAIEQMDRAAEL